MNISIHHNENRVKMTITNATTASEALTVDLVVQIPLPPMERLRRQIRRLLEKENHNA